jgi:hypothetical protein
MYFGTKKAQEVNIFRNHDFMCAELLLRDDRSTVSPLAYKGLWQKDEMNGEGIISLSNGLVVYAQFKDGIVKDTHF